MRIRDISQYIKALCGEVDLSKIGTNKELLLQTIYGKDPSPDQVKSVISDAASFASNAEEQLFYEFVQNAYDADADSLFFYANKDYLIVLNNGKPFYTDFDILKPDATITEGQLYNFLAKGKSLKRGDSKMMGKYGQGSKLLYTLLTSVDDKEENENLLIDAIYEKKKGPYLISWYNRNQLSNLLLKQPDWKPSQGDDFKNNILFAKILMSYYPIAPGEDETLFSNAEAINAIDAFDTLVDPRRNLHFLNRGTALIVPLGEGQYERITSKENLERVKTRLGGFASITRDQERNEGKTVKHIYVMGEEIEQHEVRSVFTEFKVEGKSFYYHFAFNPIFAERNFVNLFKGLPILETKLRLGFIIDSQKFDVDSSRQRINDKAKTQPQLIRAFNELVRKLRDIKISDPAKFDYIYKAILATRIPDGEDYAYIRNSFKEVFKPFFEEFVLSSSGTYEKRENVRSYSSSDQLSLSKIGITSYKWIDSDIARDLHRCVGIDVVEVDLSTILADADATRLQAWIKSLSKKDYALFHEMVDAHKTEGNVSSYKLFRSNKGNLFSFTELQSTANVYYPFEEGMLFGECEHLEILLSGIDLSVYISQLFEKIKTNIELLRTNDSLREDVANLLGWIVDKNVSYLAKVKSQIKLLPNWHNEYLAFDELLEERPKGTILFDNYVIKGKLPKVVKDGKWLLSPSNQKRPTWQWVVNHWDALKNEDGWGENTHKYISDVKSVYKALGQELTTNEVKLTLYLDEKGIPTDVLHAIVNNVSRLSEDEYNLLDEKVPHLRLLPYEYQAELQESPFKVESVQSSNIVKDGLTVDEKLLRVFIKITDAYLILYRTQENNGKFTITKTSSGMNYIDDVSADLKQDLLNAGFYHIPHAVQEILKTESTKYHFVSNDTMLVSAIKKIADPFKLLPFVKDADVNVLNAYFERVSTIDIDKKITKESYKWQTIELAVKRSSEKNDYVTTVFGAIRHNGFELPNSIIQQCVSIGDHQYDLYDLNDDYKVDNEIIDTFLKCLPSQNEVDYFKNNYYNGKEEEVSVDELYEYLHDKLMTIKQLMFCIDYSITYNSEYDELEIMESEKVEDALDMILKNNLYGFDKYFKMPNVNYNLHVYAPKELLLKEEILPYNVKKWIDSHQAILPLLSRLVTGSSPYISVRKALLEDTPFDDLDGFSDADNDVDIDTAIKWSINKKFTYIYGSERYKTMMSIIETLPSEYNVMPFLRYTGEVAPITEEESIPRPTFTLERYQDNCSFFSVYSWVNQFEERLEKSKKLSKFIKENIVYVYGASDLLYNHGLKNKPKWSIRTAADTKDFPEYSDPVYDMWKELPESKGISIHVSEEPIVMNFNILAANASIFADKMRDSEYGYEAGECVVVQQPNKEGLSVMKTIAKHIGSMEFFKEPFIALQSLYIDNWELLQGNSNGDGGSSNLNLDNSQLSEEQAQNALNTISVETAENLDKINDITKQMNSDDLDKLKEAADPIKELIDELDKDDLERLAEKKKKIMQMLDDLDEAEEEEKESQVRQTIGFIGELIYSHYLENKNKEFDHAALRGVGEYDFEIKSDNTFVDVKTTLYSLKDGTAPFYLHRSQNVFMQKHPDSKYHIVRISLNDLNLQKSYEQVRDTYGKDANPLENPNLKRRCEQIAKTYWRGAKIEEFDALSPEYSIRMELKVKK